MKRQVNRRAFLKTSAGVTASLIVGFNSSGLLALTESAAKDTNFNPFVRIDSEGMVTVLAKHFEMGQGTSTGLATLVAEEMNVRWDQVKVEFAPSDADLYKNLFFGFQGTAASSSIANSFMQYREAGAAARDALVRAAGAEWGVTNDRVSIVDGELISGDRKAGIGDFILQAAAMQPVGKPLLKDPKDFTLIGSERLHRKDNTDKTTGKAVFAMDVKVDNMLYVVILTSPRFGGVLKDFDAEKASMVHGFVDAIAMPDQSGVAVYATSTWSAIQSRSAINATWDDTAADVRGSDAVTAEFNELLDSSPQFNAIKEVDFSAIAAQVAGSENLIEATFHFPLLAHAPMEPQNCVIEPLEGGGVRIHDGCQMPTVTHGIVAELLGLPMDKVEIKTYYAGGSFGRRANFTSDYHGQAAMAYSLMGGEKAIKLVWNREDDLAGGYYRPRAAHRAHIAVGGDGIISAWSHRVVAQSISKGTFVEGDLVKDGVDKFSVEGIFDTPYGIKNMSVGLSDHETPMTRLWWRSVGHSHTAYAMESLMDMAANAADKDPVEFRLAHLDMSDPDQARFAGVLKLAAEKAGWGSDIGEKRGRGIAVHKAFSTYVAEVVEVSVSDTGKISIDKVVCAVDCGIAVNPDVIRAQMEGGIGYGLGAVMRNQITLTDGVVDQLNFPQYEPLRMRDMPDVAVHIVQSTDAPTGVGEPGLPPVGPALANAIFAATGNRVTSLPMAANGVEFS